MNERFELNSSVRLLFDRIRIPLILVAGERVALANEAARGLLGAHIVGEDVRLAIRHPLAVSLLSDKEGGTVSIGGLSTLSSVWELSVQPLDDGWRLIELHDLSAQSDVSRAHTDFVANASHELRTPLAAILGYVETLLEPQAGGDAATRTRFLGIVEREARRMQQLVDDLMSLSRIEAVKHERPDDIVDLAAIARQIMADVNAAHDKIAVVAASGSDSEALLPGDAGQLAQLIRNLVENGIRHGAAGDPVSVEVMREGNDVRLVVADKGAGIEPEHLPRLTERFYRVDPSRSRDAGGTGLGLAIVKHIVARHRGQLDIASEPGRGTSVRIRFPGA
jgi:two-component system phosphate regulon sensor histidine kinase PhoR